MVSEILYKQFYDFSDGEKIKLILKGRPRPNFLKILTCDGNTMPVEKFYEQEKCLAICERTCTIFCFPCSLFAIDNTGTRALVSTITDKDLHNLIVKHKNSPSHIYGLLQYYLFRKKYSQNLDVLRDVREGSWLVKKNKAALLQIIDVCCFLFPVLTPYEASSDVLRVGKSIEILTIMKSYEIHIVEEATNLIKVCPTILTDTVAAMAQVMKDNIKSELKTTSSAALILSNHSNGENNSKVSTVIRYVYEGKTYERLIDFAELDTCRDAAGIQQHISKLISEYEISQKFLALSCDGAVLSTKYLFEFVQSFLRLNPRHFFLPCHFHYFNCVVEQSLSRHPRAHSFFRNLTSMKIFFQNNPEACDILYAMVKAEIPKLNSFELNNFHFLRLLKLYRRQFIEVYSHIIEHPNTFLKEDITKAMGYRTILEQYETVFMLEAFFKLSKRFAAFSEMSSSSSPESVLNRRYLKGINTALTSDKNRGFEIVWTDVINELLIDSKPETLASAGEEETKQLQAFYTKIVNCVVKEINIRFSSADRLEFLSALDSKTDGKLIITDSQMESLMAVMQAMTIPFVKKNRLKAELEILSRNGAIFAGKSVSEFMDILWKADLQGTFKNVHTLAELILTMPCTPVSSQSSGPSKLDLLNAWQTIPNTPEVGFFCQLCIEQDYLTFLKSRPTFYDEVILKMKQSSSSVQELKLLL